MPKQQVLNLLRTLLADSPAIDPSQSQSQPQQQAIIIIAENVTFSLVPPPKAPAEA